MRRYEIRLCQERSTACWTSPLQSLYHSIILEAISFFNSLLEMGCGCLLYDAQVWRPHLQFSANQAGSSMQGPEDMMLLGLQSVRDARNANGACGLQGHTQQSWECPRLYP